MILDVNPTQNKDQRADGAAAAGSCGAVVDSLFVWLAETDTPPLLISIIIIILGRTSSLQSAHH